MTDLYIATPTQADYDALMRLAEAVGYMWINGCKPTEWDGYGRHEGQAVVNLTGSKLWFGSVERFEREGRTIETIPNLADIKAIWRVQPDDHKALFKGKSYKHPLPSDESVIMLEMTDELAEGLMDIHKALAVEYKPKESEEVMPEKVKFPKRLYDALQEYGLPENGNESWPVGTISGFYDQWREEESSVLGIFIDGNADNQWKLIDALRYGYEAEPEQLYYVDFGGDSRYRFLNLDTRSDEIKIDNKNQCANYKVKFTMDEIMKRDPRYKAFAVPVEEGQG